MIFDLLQLENALKTYARQGEADRFVEVMTPFLERAAQECMVVETVSISGLECSLEFRHRKIVA